jgi:hypothetical protein
VNNHYAGFAPATVEQFLKSCGRRRRNNSLYFNCAAMRAPMAEAFQNPERRRTFILGMARR